MSLLSHSNTEYIRDFFNSGKETAVKGKLLPAAVLSVEGRNYSVDVFYLDSPCADYAKACADTTIKLHEQETPGDVLIFLTGMEEVQSHCTLYTSPFQKLH